MTPYKKHKPADLDLEDLYDSEEDKIRIPAGQKVFVATGYRGRFPLLYVKVAGVTKYKRAIANIVEDEKEYPGVGMRAALVPEPSNRYDIYAIKVMVGLKIHSQCEYHIGYIPATLAKLLTQIKNRYNITYTARVESIRSNFYKGSEMSFPCSARIKLVPKTKTREAAAPRMTTLDIGTDGMTVKQLQKFLSKKRP